MHCIKVIQKMLKYLYHCAVYVIMNKNQCLIYCVLQLEAWSIQ